MIARNNVVATGNLCALTLFALLLFPITNALAHPEHGSRGKCYVIGTGPAGPEHATGKAIECIQKADVIFGSNDTLERFSTYLKGKNLLGNPWRGKFKHSWQDREKLGPEEKKQYVEERIRFWDETAARIRHEVAQGKTVALLDSGDPCVFGPSHRVIEGLREDEVEIIPGLGCFQASMAALKKSSIPAYDTRFVMLTAPMFLFGKPEDEAILKDLSKYPVTMAFYMALRHADTLIARLKKYYPSDLPVAVVYNAGYPEKEKVVKGALDTILEDIKAEKENWLGMIIVGRCLAGQPQRGMVKHMSQ
ncbi:MAG: tetrapyrrole methylase [Deltaproteobacteria bacterium]|nr:tetrapyrrole methylase [Deltaproteobacteria bacterium]